MVQATCEQRLVPVRMAGYISSKNVDEFDTNPGPSLTAWDLCLTLVVLAVYAPLSILTSICQKGMFLQWNQLAEHIQHELIICLGCHLPMAMIQRFQVRKDDLPWRSPRYAHIPSALQRKVQTPQFAAYWITDTRPQDADLILFHFHGGGYVLGHPLENATELLLIAETVTKKLNQNVAILSLEYSLAPQAAFPTQLTQALAAYTWLTEDQGLDSEKIYLIGESAGGHLVLSLLVALHHQFLFSLGEKSSLHFPKPGAALLISPWVNLNPRGIPFGLEGTGSDSSQVTQAKGPTRSVASDARFRKMVDRFSWAAFRGTPIEFRALYGNFAAVAAQRGSWGEILPSKTWVSAGTEEPLFRTDIELFVDCARRDGAEKDEREVLYEVKEGGVHVWQTVEARQGERQFLSSLIGGDDDPRLLSGYRHIAGVISTWLEIGREQGGIGIEKS